ncbi:MAG: CHAT domain-containing protein, partial [Saprospiraceae bacterium]|nr:CHAT domain-containing protein [Saprospiraceae bacterium]
KYMRETFGPEYYDQLLPLSNLSSNYLQKGNLAAADSFSNQGIDLMKSLGWSRLSPDGDYYLDDGLAQLANRLEIGTASFNQSGNISDLEKVVNYGKDYIATVNHAFHGLENSPSKEIFQKFHSPLFSIAIDNLYTLYEHTHTDSLLEIALNYIEQYKSLEIYYAVQKDNIGDDPVFRELNLDRSRLQDSIKWLESQLIQTSGDPIIRKSLDRFTQQLYQWQKMVRTSYPEYFLLVYQPDRIHLATLQKKIGAIDQSILTYHVADSFIYVMLINSDQVFFKRIKVETPVSESISSLRNNVFAYFLSPERSEELYELYATAFVEESVHLYDILLKPIDTNLRKKVTIIPDKSLGYLSFAPLLAKPPENPLQFKRHAYFIRDHVIAYNYSVHLIFESNANTKRHNNQLLAVAPSYKSSTIPPSDLAIRAGLSPLTYNEAEVLSINDRLGGDHLLGDQATKSTFLSYAPNYNILHLAMHSKANDEFGNLSYLAFSNVGNESFRLSASEIYALHLNCDLVTLSACETGLGELQEGEGIIGLARAFFIAGARSIVSTLWTVNDHSTATIMSSFYQNLGKNKSKDVALQQAQLTYLQDVDHLGAHPFFWSGYQAVGNMSSLKKTIYSRYIIFILFISVLLIGGRWIWSRISFSTGQ